MTSIRLSAVHGFRRVPSQRSRTQSSAPRRHACTPPVPRQREMHAAVIGRRLQPVSLRLVRCYLDLFCLLNCLGYSLWSAFVAHHYSLCLQYVNYVVNLGGYLVVLASEGFDLRVLPVWRKPERPTGIGRFFPLWYVVLVLFNCSLSVTAAISDFLCQPGSDRRAYGFLSELLSLMYLNFIWKLYPLDALQAVRSLYRHFTAELNRAAVEKHLFKRVVESHRENYYQIARAAQPELLLHIVCAFVSAVTSLAMLFMWADVGHAKLIDLVCVPMDIVTSCLVVFILCHYPAKLEDMYKRCKRHHMHTSLLLSAEKDSYVHLLAEMRLRPFQLRLFDAVTLNRQFVIGYMYSILALFFTLHFLPQDTFDEQADAVQSVKPVCVYLDWLTYFVEI